MHVTLVHVHVTPEHLEGFIDETRANHEASVRQPGNCGIAPAPVPSSRSRLRTPSPRRDNGGRCPLALVRRSLTP